MNFNEEYCFVIMPFKDELRGVYDDAIKPAIESQSLKCYRQDEIAGSGSIVREIIECIAHAKLIVADLTGQNPNVFYELGIAHALFDKTIVITQEVEDVPFDVKVYKTINYRNTISGGRKLGQDLMRAIGGFKQWGQKPTNPVSDYLPETFQIYNYTGEMAREFEMLQHDNFILSERLRTMQQLLGQLFKNALPGQHDQDDVVGVMKNIINEVQQKGEVSLQIGETEENPQGFPSDAPPKDPQSRTGGKIIFRKLDKDNKDNS